ncbi:gliding motility-associated C-terminal domain-containing protein [Flavisolibacter nicotianae]|uniref:gliding motility-associated C-terminal domain-containing protein n=1 Tax=Flavisolibacter nicotianae TaxID=2364882 RepID=UPI0013C47B10|nr:gliding motility-associated C-terminal domain-containing protein [Flavisolibacter nicotianae]
MVLYFATEAVTNVTVSIPGLGYSATYSNIPANSIFTTNPLPKTGGQDARLTAEGISSKGVHITSDKPIVAYAHVFDGNVSGATLLFPTNTLGKEYYSVNFNQVSNEALSNCWMYAVAVDTGTTVVQITPSGNTLTHPAGTPFTVSLSQGQIINLMGQLENSSGQPYLGVDLTGSTIKSIGGGSGGCKRIAVFSGSGKISITCDGTSASSDNYMVQAFPKTAWGKRYLTAPTRNFTNNFFRICVTDPATVVKVNGAVLTGLKNNFYYEIKTSSPSLIEASQPVLVAQYITTQGACGNAPTTGDPEVIYLSPVEQNIDKVILNSTSNYAITQHFVNVVIRSVAVPSFRLDGSTVNGFSTHPQDPSYSYAQLTVGAGKHTLQADSGFNAIAYGYGEFESYGYNAGTNVKDLYQFVSVHNQYATVAFPAACKNSPFYFSMTFPYQPMQIKWMFGQTLNAMGMADVTLDSPKYDSTWVVNGKQLYRYKLPATYTITAVGTYPIRILAQNATQEGCSGEQEMNYDLQVFERPSASFAVTSSGCLSEPVQFTDQSNLSGRNATQWFWDFGDGKASFVHNPVHQYSSAGAYPVKFALVSDVGCLSDTATRTVAVSEPPVARFGISKPSCVGKSLTFTDSSVTATSTIAKWTWDFGDNSTKVIATSGAPQSHTFANAGTYSVSLQVENAGGCKSLAYTKEVTVSTNPVAGFHFGNACLPSGVVQFTNSSTVADGTLNQLTYAWNFGDGGSAVTKDPSYAYKTAGPFTTSLVVTSVAGCKDSISQTVNTIYQQPAANFSAPSEICLGATVNFTDQSTAPGSSVESWEWDFGDGTPIATQQSPSHNFAKAGTYTVSLKVRSAIGCLSAAGTKTIVVNPLPTADFTVSSPLCVNGTILFTNQSKANAGSLTRSAWDFGDGSPTSGLLSPSHLYNKEGRYSVSLTVETDKGCQSPVTTRTIEIHPLPKVGFVVPGTCINDIQTTFMDSSSISDGSEKQFQWLWNFGDANTTPTSNVSAFQNGQHRYTATGDYSVSLKVTSKDGCSASLTQVFTVNGAEPVALFSLQKGGQQCSNDPLVLVNNSFVSPGKLVKLEIYWDYNTDPTNKLTADKPVQGQLFQHVYPVFYSPATKSYRLKYVVYSGVSCVSEKDTTITLLAVPDLVFDPLAPVCANLPAFQLQAGVNNGTAGTGVYSGKGVSPVGIFNPAAAGAGDHEIRYTYTAANGCKDQKSQVITVLPVPTVSAGPDKVVLEGGSVVLNGSGGSNVVRYNWSPAAGLSDPFVSQPVASPAADVTYILTVTSADGCKATDDVLVKVLKTPVVPNAFSPNGDGVHDRWEIPYLDSYPGATVEIFNRYGQKVFESKGYTRPWDGTLNGKALPIGTYYYLIDPKNGRKPLSGFVDIIR